MNADRGRSYVEDYLATVRGAPLVASFERCLDALPVDMQVRLIEALDQAGVAPSSPAWLMFAVVAEFLRELESARAALGTSARADAHDIQTALERAVTALSDASERLERATTEVPALMARERALTLRLMRRYRQTDRMVVALALAAGVLVALVAIVVR